MICTGTRMSGKRRQQFVDQLVDCQRTASTVDRRRIGSPLGPAHDEADAPVPQAPASIESTTPSTMNTPRTGSTLLVMPQLMPAAGRSPPRPTSRTRSPSSVLFQYAAMSRTTSSESPCSPMAAPAGNGYRPGGVCGVLEQLVDARLEERDRLAHRTEDVGPMPDREPRLAGCARPQAPWRGGSSARPTTRGAASRSSRALTRSPSRRSPRPRQRRPALSRTRPCGKPRRTTIRPGW
jgi:hypothetical protein